MSELQLHFIHHPITGARLVICPKCLWTAQAPGTGLARARVLINQHECETQ